MSDPPTIPAPQYTLTEAISVCLAMCERCLAEVRALELMPGPQGEKGERGEPGKQGLIGERGAKGEPGRNAADLTLLQSHIEDRVAAIFKAATITTPDFGRTLLVTLGDKIHEVKTATPLDAGVWKESTYSPGDGVTHGGSWFIAQAETTAKPGKSDDWRLAVKRGADGRDWRPDEKRAPELVRFR